MKSLVIALVATFAVASSFASEPAKKAEAKPAAPAKSDSAPAPAKAAEPAKK